MAIAMMAEMLNLLRSAMSAWIVGKVDAPANANMIEPKAEGAEFNENIWISNRKNLM